MAVGDLGKASDPRLLRPMIRDSRRHGSYLPHAGRIGKRQRRHQEYPATAEEREFVIEESDPLLGGVGPPNAHATRRVGEDVAGTSQLALAGPAHSPAVKTIRRSHRSPGSFSAGRLTVFGRTIQSAGPVKPAWLASIGWKPSFQAGESGCKRKSYSPTSTNLGSAMIE